MFILYATWLVERNQAIQGVDQSTAPAAVAPVQVIDKGYN